MELHLIFVVVFLFAANVTCQNDQNDDFVQLTFRPQHAYYIFAESDRTVRFNFTTNFNGTVHLLIRSNDSFIATVSRFASTFNTMDVDDSEFFLEDEQTTTDVIKYTASETVEQFTFSEDEGSSDLNGEDAEDELDTLSSTLANGNEEELQTVSTGVTDNAGLENDASVFADNLIKSNGSEPSYNIMETQRSKQRNQSTLTVQGLFLGRTFLEFFIYSNHSDFPRFMYSVTNENFTVQRAKMEDGKYWFKLPYKFPVSVIRKRRAIDQIFTYCIMVIVFLANIGLGCKIDLQLVKETLKKPLAPGIGFFCQFLIMPLLSYALATSLNFDKKIGLGFFAMGCSPGGGASNFYTLLLDGDVSLSCTMTILSTVFSFAMIPMWIFTLGQNFLEDGNNVKIPFTNIIISLSIMLIAFSIGVLIEHKKKKWSKIIVKIIAPLIIIAVLIIFVVGVWANLYIFKLYTPMMVLAGCALPYGGFVLGGFIAFGFRLPWKSVKTIAIETGIQNTAIPIVLMAFSLPYPEADLAIVAPGAAALFMPIPLWFAIAGRKIWIRCKGYRKLPSNEKEAEANEDINKNDTDKDYVKQEYDSDGVEVRVSTI